MFEWLIGWKRKQGMLSYSEIKQAHVELSSYCNSWCPTCPRNFDGGPLVPDFRPNSLSLNDFKQIFEPQLISRMAAINFCGNYGDPGMCKDLVEILDYIASCNSDIDVTIHTNGGMRSTDFWKQVAEITPRLPRLRVIFSIDGLEDTNHIYRVGVQWSKLIKNVTAFINAGGKAEWDFLVFKHNEHQLAEAKSYAKELGFVKFNPGNPHGFKYNDTIRVINRKGEFQQLLERNTVMPQPINDNKNIFDDIEYNIAPVEVKLHFQRLNDESLDPTHRMYNEVRERLAQFDTVEIKECMCKDLKEIYIDSHGGVHPCCFLGHVDQDSQQIHEMVLHKKWIEDTFGFENINALKRPLKDIINSDYFTLIEESWDKTFEEGRNPVCVLKCGVQRPNNQIKK